MGFWRQLALVLAICSPVWANADDVVLVGSHRSDGAWSWVQAGFRERLAEYSRWDRKEIQVINRSPSSHSAEAQKEILQKLLRESPPEALVIDPIDADVLATELDILKKRSVPIFAVLNPLPAEYGEAFVGVDNSDLVRSQRVVAVDLSHARSGWLVDVLAPGMTVPEPSLIGLPDIGNWSSSAIDSSEVAIFLMQTAKRRKTDHPVAWIFHDPTLFYDPEPLRPFDGARVGAFADSIALQCLERGQLDAVVIPHYPEIGSLVADQVWNFLRYGMEPEEEQASVGVLIISSNNLDHWHSLWRRWQR